MPTESQTFGVSEERAKTIVTQQITSRMAGERGTPQVSNSTNSGTDFATFNVNLQNTYEPSTFTASASMVARRFGFSGEEPTESAGVKNLNTNAQGNVTGFTVEFTAAKVESDNFVSWSAFGLTV
jgi:hypothetical protein